MTRLEDAVQHDLSNAPEPSPVESIERRAQRRRARELMAGSGAAVLVAAISVAGFVWTRPSATVAVRTTSPSTSNRPTTTTVPGLPLATTAVFPRLEEVLARVHAYEAGDGHVESAEIVATTVDKTFVLFGGRPNDHRPAYLVHLAGDFTCNGCSVPVGAHAPHGHDIYFTDILVPGTPEDAFSIGNRKVDLSAFGRVYRLPGYSG